MTESQSQDIVWQRSDWIQHTRCLLNSYEKLVGSPLISRATPQQDACRIFEAPFVVVAHGMESDPLLNYGNATALALWEMSLSEFLGTPSRKTAEPLHRDERADLLHRTQRDGYIDNYSGIRIASSGQRFQIHKAIVWNVVDDDQQQIGQAATFSDWTTLQ